MEPTSNPTPKPAPTASSAGNPVPPVAPTASPAPASPSSTAITHTHSANPTTTVPSTGTQSIVSSRPAPVATSTAPTTVSRVGTIGTHGATALNRSTTTAPRPTTATTAPRPTTATTAPRPTTATTAPRPATAPATSRPAATTAQRPTATATASRPATSTTPATTRPVAPTAARPATTAPRPVAPTAQRPVTPTVPRPATQPAPTTQPTPATQSAPTAQPTPVTPPAVPKPPEPTELLAALATKSNEPATETPANQLTEALESPGPEVSPAEAIKKALSETDIIIPTETPTTPIVPRKKTNPLIYLIIFLVVVGGVIAGLFAAGVLPPKFNPNPSPSPQTKEAVGPDVSLVQGVCLDYNYQYKQSTEVDQLYLTTKAELGELFDSLHECISANVVTTESATFDYTTTFLTNNYADLTDDETDKLTSTYRARAEQTPDTAKILEDSGKTFKFITGDQTQYHITIIYKNTITKINSRSIDLAETVLSELEYPTNAIADETTLNLVKTPEQSTADGTVPEQPVTDDAVPEQTVPDETTPEETPPEE